ncbi:MAG: flavin reductase [Bacteroidetes bacterium]|nr:flavin reductase [Bacteroidota bacterium]
MRRPWNIVDQPVYSLATYADGHFNMNICTYVTAVSMSPKMYAVAVYHNTKTLFNLQNTDTAVLQLLSTEQIKLVNILGKNRGIITIRKITCTRKINYNLARLSCFRKCCGFIITKQKTVIPSGDHELFCLM